MIERTLVLVKPDGVARGLIGEIIKRFENAGLKIIGIKMVWADKKSAEKHYTEEIAKKHGKHVRDWLLEYIVSGPVVAIVLEGVESVNVVRKLVGTTYPHDSPPGTIRGDFCHVNMERADEQKKAIMNLIHASGSKSEAKQEIAIWFNSKELHSYKTVHEAHAWNKGD